MPVSNNITPADSSIFLANQNENYKKGAIGHPSGSFDSKSGKQEEPQDSISKKLSKNGRTSNVENNKISSFKDQNQYADQDLRDVGSRNSRLSKTMPKEKHDENERPLDNSSKLDDEVRDEATQMTPLIRQDVKPDTAGTMDFGAQFASDNMDDNEQSKQGSVEEPKAVILMKDDEEEDKQSLGGIHLDDDDRHDSGRSGERDNTNPISRTNIPASKKQPLNEFADEQGTGQFKSISDSDVNLKVSEKQSEYSRKINTFDSRKTSLSKDVRLDDEDRMTRRETSKHIGDSDNTETRDDDRNFDSHNRLTDPMNETHMKNLALYTLKDWKDSQIYDWYSMATKSQRANFVAHVIQRENQESENSIQVLDMKELNNIMNLVSSREYVMKKSVKTQNNPDGTTSEAYIKFDAFNIIELFETLNRTITFVYGLFCLDKYILHRVYGLYNVEITKAFMTAENAIKL